MSEQDSIDLLTGGPNTVRTLERDFRALGISEGMTLLVHASMSSLGWVCGGAQAVILALENVLGRSGTLVMPAHSGDLSDPKNWQHPPVPESWQETIRNEMPAFDRKLTPTRGMGKIAESFRVQEGVVRSGHPQMSFAAWGRHKDYVTQDAHYDNALNEESPLGRVRDLDGFVLLIGVGHDNNTSIHLAEYIAKYATKKAVMNGMPLREGDATIWKEFADIDYFMDDFETIGADFERTGAVATGKIGAAECRLMRQRNLVDFAVQWMEQNRK